MILHQEYAIVVATLDASLGDGVLADAHKHLRRLSEKVRGSKDSSIDAADLEDLEALDDAIEDYISAVGNCKRRITDG